MRGLIIAIAASLSVSACAVNNLNKFDQLRPGVSTIQDAQTLLGPAKAYSDVGGGRTLLQWMQFNTTGVGHLGIIFRSSDGKMIQVSNVTYN